MPDTQPSEPSTASGSPSDPVSPIVWWRLALTALLIPLTIHAFGDEYGQVPLLSDIDLAVHEFGHMLFMPFGIRIFGDTGVTAGGAITQVMVPLLFAAYFLFGPKQHRDVHAATVALWWAAMNVLSVAIYAGDARAGQLTLINGATGEDDPEGHDFHALFEHWGVLNRDTIYAARLRNLAALMSFVAIAGGLVAALRVRKRPASEAAVTM